ncbi:MAG: hypothetical protein ACT4QF_07790 [Sporichthyaceae bacterium]
MPRTLLRPGWVALHLLTLVVVVAFVRLGWWQLVRAREGNALSIGYALEWPVFAVFTLAVWVWLCRDALRRERAGAGAAPIPEPAPNPTRVPDELVLPSAPAPLAAVFDSSQPCEDPELAAYNRMLAAYEKAPRR